MAYETYDAYDAYDHYDRRDARDDYDEFEYRRHRDVVVRKAPTPGVAAVLSVLIPGLGQVYAGRLIPGAIWFLATMVSYSAVLLPGFLVHAFCVWSAYSGARDWRP